LQRQDSSLGQLLPGRVHNDQPPTRPGGLTPLGRLPQVAPRYPQHRGEKAIQQQGQQETQNQQQYVHHELIPRRRLFVLHPLMRKRRCVPGTGQGNRSGGILTVNHLDTREAQHVPRVQHALLDRVAVDLRAPVASQVI